MRHEDRLVNEACKLRWAQQELLYASSRESGINYGGVLGLGSLTTRTTFFTKESLLEILLKTILFGN